ncbi:hypothetical protein HYQ46_000567 [Verticillium longisporum]|nr:hypothetical protein HYQ46_000567 [Verticillium longisporum]
MLKRNSLGYALRTRGSTLSAMHFPAQTLPLAFAAILPIATAFEFTGPDANQPLNLSAPTTVTWQHDGTDHTSAYRHLELSWRVQLAGDRGEYGDVIKANISLQTGDGKYEWDATEAATALQQGDEDDDAAEDAQLIVLREHEVRGNLVLENDAGRKAAEEACDGTCGHDHGDDYFRMAPEGMVASPGTTVAMNVAAGVAPLFGL